jgi:hypothetical protein
MSQLSANNATLNKSASEEKVDQTMSLQFEFERDPDSSAEKIRSEIQERDCSLRNIHAARLCLALQLEENLALHRAVALRQRQSFAPMERGRSLRVNGRVR